MSFRSRLISLAAALGALLAVLPARAQMDSRLQVVQTDVLDVYQTTPGKPEMLTMFDFSGSMHAVYFDEKYWTDANEDSHSAAWSVGPKTGDFPGFVPCFDKNGYIWMFPGTGYYQDYFDGGSSQPSQFQTSSSKPTAQLIAPNGSAITINHSTTYTQSTLIALVKQASHIRVTATSGSTTRTIDLPIPWAVFDSTQTSSTNAFNTILSYTDSIGGGPAVVPDTLYTKSEGDLGAGDNIVNAQGNGNDNNYWKIGRFHYNADYLWWIFFGKDVRNANGNGSTAGSSFVIPDTSTATAWNNGLVGFTRYQGLKSAVIQAWLANQKKVWWALRFLDSSEEKKTTVSPDSQTLTTLAGNRKLAMFRAAANSSTEDPNVAALANLEPSTSTPLTYAVANSLAQLAQTSTTLSNDIFGPAPAVQTTPPTGTDPNPIPPCRQSYLIAFTDGIANDGLNSGGDGSALGSGDPYSAGTDTLGNAAVNSTGLSKVQPGNSMFNIWTLAGLAAHYPMPAGWTGPSGTTSVSVQNAVPFLVTSRGATTATPRRVRTITVGVSLAGALTDPAGGQGALFRAALYGNPSAKSWSLSTQPYDPTNINSDPTSQPFFFNATDVNKLSVSLTAILAQVTAGSASVSAPSSPLVGLSLGNEAYLGLFQTVTGPRWVGDLLMAGLYVGPQGVSYIGNSSDNSTSNTLPVTPILVSNITDENAMWSASKVFRAGTRNWTYPTGVGSASGPRNLYTNLPGTTTLVPLIAKGESTQSGPGSGQVTDAMLAAPDDATAASYVRFIRGANSSALTGSYTAAASSELSPRPDIMGDIIDSSPAVLEYPTSVLSSNPSISASLSSLLSTAQAAHQTCHFRVIFVGDNQGIFHAFGEVSYSAPQNITVTNQDGTTSVVSVQIPNAAVDEIWAFYPGEYLKSISQLITTTNPHRYMTDGAPYIYFKDVPASGQVVGNGIVDGTDVVRVIIGERKGGRSYYAFDFSNLANAVNNTGSIMSWKLVPDDITATDAQSTVLKNMGFSTSTPAVGRVDTSSGTTKDMLFLGGGLSVSATDSQFSTKLGRSLVAFDVASGPSTSLYTWDFTASGFTSAFGAMGSVSTGVVPFQFFAGSQRTQRVYFSDTPTDANVSATSPRGGGLWALGSTALASNGVIRLDSSSIDAWTSGSTTNTIQGIRHIADAPTGWSISTMPTPFLLSGPYPVPRASSATDPSVLPVAVGISFGTGDRNDPMDNDSINPAVTSGSTVTPYNNWMCTIFDRQDSSNVSGVSGLASGATPNLDSAGMKIGKATGDGDSDLANLTTVSSFTGAFSGYSVDPSNASYYLKQKLGYKLNMGASTSKGSSSTAYYFPKVITEALVLNGVLFFSDFLPAPGTSSCQGTGVTNTYRICNVLQPTFNSGGTNASPTSFNGGDPTCSGIVLTFPNLPGQLTALGTGAVIQSGQGSVNGAPGTIDNAGAKVGGSFGKTSGFAFKPRTWRVVR